jgi:hypothetical protein
MLNFLKGVVQLPFLEQSIISIGDIEVRIYEEPDQTVWMCRLAWLYTGTSVPAG